MRISPLGKVPVLRVGDAVLFESSVICEYLDEMTPPSLHPADPLDKVLNRAWIEYSSELFVALYHLAHAVEENEFVQRRQTARSKIELLEQQLGEGPFFNGSQFSLVDAASAPAFLRISLMEALRPMGLLDQLPRVMRWCRALLERPSVRNSVVPEFPDLFRDNLIDAESFLVQGVA